MKTHGDIPAGGLAAPSGEITESRERHLETESQLSEAHALLAKGLDTDLPDRHSLSLRAAVVACQRYADTGFRSNEAMSAFGDRVKQRRLFLGMSQAELARKSGFKSAGSIGDIEQGTQDETRHIDLLAKALETTSHFLRTGLGTDFVQATPSFDAREAALIEKFRNLSEPDKQRVEAYLHGMKPSRRGPRSRSFPFDTEVSVAGRKRKV